MKPDNTYTFDEFNSLRLETLDPLDYYTHCIKANGCKNRGLLNKWKRKIETLECKIGIGIENAREDIVLDSTSHNALKALEDRLSECRNVRELIDYRLNNTKPKYVREYC